MSSAGGGGRRVSTPSLIRVWDPLVRFFHWGLVLSIGVSWLSANSLEDLHNSTGYAAGALVGARAAWGLVGSRYARFSDFVRSPRTVLAYLADIGRGQEARYIGHNPAGGAMVICLLLATAATALTGWLLTTDSFWGVRWMQHLHDLLAHVLLLLAGIHIGGVMLASFRHRENLVGAMIFGRKRRED
ncbi:MAG TPA: cytochrome b/b6 domain-containing protein [Stellaceae bacterium]|nr:cytochrome b/b6 domain-containing protein [Stellaceae bacterium]